MLRSRARGAVLVLSVALAGAGTLQPVAAGAPASARGPEVNVFPRSATHTSVVSQERLTWRLDASHGWSSDQQDTDVASYDVRIARTPMRAAQRADWRYPDHLQGMTVTESERGRGDIGGARKLVRLRLAKGQVLCLSARATDVQGNVGSWVSQVCVTRLWDDRHLTRRDGARVVADRRFWDGAATVLGPDSGALRLRQVATGSQVTVLWRAEQRAGGPRLAAPRGDGLVKLCDMSSFTRVGGHRLSSCRILPRKVTADRQSIWLLGRSRTPVAVEGIAIMPAWAR